MVETHACMISCNMILTYTDDRYEIYIYIYSPGSPIKILLKFETYLCQGKNCRYFHTYADEDSMRWSKSFLVIFTPQGFLDYNNVIPGSPNIAMKKCCFRLREVCKCNKTTIMAAKMPTS